MKKYIIALLLVITSTAYAQQPYEKAWQALNENNRSEAEKLLLEAENTSSSFQDAYISKIYLKSYNGKESTITDFNTAFYPVVENPYPYIYALWFNQAVMGLTGKKSFTHQLKMVDKLLADEKAPGTLVASTNYQKGMHNLFSNAFDKTQRYFDAVGSIRNWQYTGPFENLSESGFFKDYGPLENPGPEAVFKSLTNADVKWITPPDEIKDGWIPVCYQFNNLTAVVYAQNFVNSPTDQTVYCNVGATGAVKVWINDQLVISESKERVTEMDTYTVKYNLKKGANRVLIQLGFTNTSYPNFTVRFTDERYRQIPGITGSPLYTAYPKANNPNEKFTAIAPFAETFFKEKISSQPDNLVNYLLLADVYMRNKKVIEARDLLTVAINKAPKNCLLKMKMVEVLLKENNRTLLLEEVAKIKQADPESLIVMDLNLRELFDNQKYEDGAAELNKRINMYGEDETTYGYKILSLVQDKKYEEMVKIATEMYRKYPENAKLIPMMYAIQKEVYKNNKEAIKVYESYMKNNYNYNLFENYANLMNERGNKDKALDIKKMLADVFPYSPEEFNTLAKYYYGIKKYDKAGEYIKKSLALAPYNETYWERLGDIMSEQNETAQALEAYNQSLKYNPNQYTILNKVRKLQGKSELYKLFPDVDIAQTIKTDNPDEAKNTDFGYYYILDEKNVIIYPDGATEEYYTQLIKITNEKGIDQFKESSIWFSNTQNLLIEKTELIKKNQSKIEGERNENQIVFTNLEVGDVVVFKYRLQSYVYGRFAKEYWDKYFFGGQVYSSATRYNLMAPAGLKINYVFQQSTVKPVIKDVEDFKMYSWELRKTEPLKYEPLMPVVADIGEVLHVSTIPEWKDITHWYRDVSNNSAENDFEIVALYKQLFPEGMKPMNEFQKARIIYDYMESNIRYSSVSFRQSAYVPQRATATLTTRLGDCKDLSSLFVTLAQMAGIKAQMVLVNTRNNGQKDIVLPGVEFDHCIVKTTLDNKEYYIELTDNYLPFASLPNNLIGSVILEIPSKNVSGNDELKLLSPVNRTKDAVKRIMDIKPGETDLAIAVKTIKYGSLSSGVRSGYLNLDNDKQKQGMEESIASSYKNNVKIDQISFGGLDKLDDSVTYNYNYTVKNEISEIGSLQTFRITYPDIVASLDKFSSDTRISPVEYWSYEDADAYETIVNISAPAGKKFIELPASETLSFKDIKFTIQYTLKAPDQLVVTRKFTSSRQNIAPSDYTAFKTFFEKIVRAEQKFIAYK